MHHKRETCNRVPAVTQELQKRKKTPRIGQQSHREPEHAYCASTQAHGHLRAVESPPQRFCRAGVGGGEGLACDRSSGAEAGADCWYSRCAKSAASRLLGLSPKKKGSLLRLLLLPLPLFLNFSLRAWYTAPALLYTCKGAPRNLKCPFTCKRFRSALAHYCRSNI